MDWQLFLQCEMQKWSQHQNRFWEPDSKEVHSRLSQLFWRPWTKVPFQQLSLQLQMDNKHQTHALWQDISEKKTKSLLDTILKSKCLSIMTIDNKLNTPLNQKTHVQVWVSATPAPLSDLTQIQHSHDHQRPQHLPDTYQRHQPIN